MLRTIRALILAAIALLLAYGSREQASATAQGRGQRDEAALKEPFKGITTDGKVIAGLFSIQKTGISTKAIQDAASAFLASLDEPQRAKTFFASVDDDEWRRWHNIHRWVRQGVSVGEMTATQRERAFALLKESLSARGFTTARDIMRLNEVIAEMTGKPDEYGEGRYHFTIMGTPSSDLPWGWQLDGHHLVINCFVLRDQIVMTPAFMGSEPVRADSGKYAGTRVFEAEEANGLALMRALMPDQRQKAVLAPQIPAGIFTAAFRDNFEMRYEGIRYADLTSAQQTLLLRLVDTYVGNMRPGHAKIRMDEVKKHLNDTYFAWMGGFDDASVFYYRVHSPVVLIEFDHQGGVALRTDGPTRNHIHTVVRTPNGNDYGKDLLRQHHEQVDHTRPAQAR